MPHSKPFDQPSNVCIEEGTVLVDGPDGIAFAMTPAAAHETGKRLIEMSAQADLEINGRP